MLFFKPHYWNILNAILSRILYCRIYIFLSAAAASPAPLSFVFASLLFFLLFILINIWRAESIISRVA